MTPFVWLVALAVLGLIASAFDLAIGLRKLGRLAEEAPLQRAPAPLVSLIVAARDEERGIEAAMRSLLAQDYSAYEVVAVDDRSRDQTGAILDRLAAAHPRLRVVHVRELPAGWLGKNHALAVAARAARGEWLLFTDGDVVMAPTTLARAIALVERRGLDHLALLPDIHTPGLLLEAFVTGFSVVGLLALRPWAAEHPKRRATGIGAFNLVRAAAYARVAGHEPIRLRPDDDIKLGKLLKQSGARQAVLLGRELVSVEWYPSLASAIEGLMKNSFAVVEYRSALALGAALFYLVLALGPLALLFLGNGIMRGLGGLALATQLAMHLYVARVARQPLRAALLFPLVDLLLGWIVLRAMLLTLARRGIVWRDTFYPLAELRKNRI